MKLLSKSKLNRHFESLGLIANGIGAMKIPQEVKLLELFYKADRSVEHRGAKKFHDINLPRIQFHNPSLPIKVYQIVGEEEELKNKDIPALLKVHYENEVKKLDLAQKQHDSIAEQLAKLVDATPADVVDVKKK